MYVKRSHNQEYMDNGYGYQGRDCYNQNQYYNQNYNGQYYEQRTPYNNYNQNYNGYYDNYNQPHPQYMREQGYNTNSNYYDENIKRF